jgi:hypothetical protein
LVALKNLRAPFPLLEGETGSEWELEKEHELATVLEPGILTAVRDYASRL